MWEQTGTTLPWPREKVRHPDSMPLQERTCPREGCEEECSECFQQAALPRQRSENTGGRGNETGLRPSWEVVSSQVKRHFRAPNLWEELSGQRNILDPLGPDSQAHWMLTEAGALGSYLCGLKEGGDA